MRQELIEMLRSTETEFSPQSGLPICTQEQILLRVQIFEIDRAERKARKPAPPGPYPGFNSLSLSTQVRLLREVQEAERMRALYTRNHRRSE